MPSTTWAQSRGPRTLWGAHLAPHNRGPVAAIPACLHRGQERGAHKSTPFCAQDSSHRLGQRPLPSHTLSPRRLTAPPVPHTEPTSCHARTRAQQRHTAGAHRPRGQPPPADRAHMRDDISKSRRSPSSPSSREPPPTLPPNPSPLRAAPSEPGAARRLLQQGRR